MSRSTQGCWTCRVRHKKCDESRPSCNACTSRKVHCHGYGEKPAWLNGGPLEDAYRKEIKKAVKQNFKSLRRANPSSARLEGQAQRDGQHELLTAMAHQGDDHSITQTSDVSHSPGVTHDPRVSSPQIPTGLRGPYGSQLPNGPLGQNVFGYRDAELLMHYFDYVFPLQFRFHRRDLDNGGRGWLLWLLVKTGPLYHATLSLAALHQYHIRYHDQSEKYAELNTYHSKALNDLQLFLQENQATNGLGDSSRQIEVLACGVSLISFELFRGGVSDWQLHLNALSSIVQNLDLSVLDAERRTQDDHVRGPATSSGIERAAFPFLIAVVLWFDILSCVSTSTKPRLPYHTLMNNHSINLENVMGCQNWAMTAIADLAVMNGMKKLAPHTNILVEGEFRERSEKIRDTLEQGLATLDPRSDSSLQSARDNVTAIAFANTTVVNVTRVFASAALVQLHTLIESATCQLDIRTAVQKTIEALNQVQDHQDLRGLVWPICISGCMAEPHQQAFFETLVKTVVGESLQDFGNSTTSLRIMQRCWALRLVDPSAGWDWESTMAEMNICGLLV